MRKLIQLTGFICLSIITAGMDSSFFPAISQELTYVNLTLIISLFLITTLQVQIGMYFYILTSLIIGLTSGQLLILPVAIGSIILLVINLLFETIFTNR